MSLIYMGRACEKETKSFTISFYFLAFLLHKDEQRLDTHQALSIWNLIHFL